MEQSEQRILRSFPPEGEWDNDCDMVVRIWSDEPTPEEIKAAHGKCGTCSYYKAHESFCACPYNNVFAPEPTDYCNHHEPKET